MVRHGAFWVTRPSLEAIVLQTTKFEISANYIQRSSRSESFKRILPLPSESGLQRAFRCRSPK
jgi:hypothetical protein